MSRTRRGGGARSIPSPRDALRRVLRRGVPREDGARVSRGSAADGVGAPPDGQAARRDRCRGLWLRSLGVATGSSLRRNTAGARLLPARTHRASNRACGPARVGPAPARRRLPGPESHRDDQHLRGAVSSVDGSVRSAIRAAPATPPAWHDARWHLAGAGPLDTLDQPVRRCLFRPPARGAEAEKTPAPAGNIPHAARLRPASPGALWG